MKRTSLKKTLAAAAAGAVLALACAAPATADIVVRNVTVHTMTSAGKLEGVDILVSGDRITAIGKGVDAPANARSVDGKGRIVTPGLFGGLTLLGLTEIGMDPNSEDYALHLAQVRPEFDVSYAFNPDSTSIGVSRQAGVTFAAIVPMAEEGSSSQLSGTLIAGQGDAITLDGQLVPNARALYIEMGGDGNGLSGGSRAAQFMLLKQAILEARTPNALIAQDQRLLTPAGREALLRYLNPATKGSRRVIIDVDRASDILQVLAFAQQENLQIAISSGAEAWRVAKALAAAKVPVILDPLQNLPGSFDTVGSTLENAARLHTAGVSVAFSFAPEAHNVRKLRQAAGVAVAHGLPWEAGLAGLTRVPAEVLGIADRVGTLEAGRRADFVVWSGDPLDVTSTAEHVFINGVAQPLRSRQTELRDRYFERVKNGRAR